MRGENRDANRGWTNRKVGDVEDFARLVDQLGLLAGVAALADVAGGKQVERDLMLKELRSDLLALAPCHGLRAQLLDAADARTRHGLEAGRDDALELARVVQRLQRHHGYDGRAVGACDDALMLARCGGIDFRHHQRHRRLHSKCARLIDYDRARLDRDWRELFRLAAARGEERDIDTLERFRADRIDRERLALKGHLLADRSRRRIETDFPDREVAFFQQLESGLAHRAGGANYSDSLPIGHSDILSASEV